MAPMAKRDRAAYMRHYRATRKHDQERTETVTVRLTAAELGDLQRKFAEWDEYPEHATLQDMVLATLRVEAAPFDSEQAAAYDALPDDERARTPDPFPEGTALLLMCHASGCTCPVVTPDPAAAEQWLAGAAMPGRTWRRCAASDGAAKPSMTPAQ